MGGSSWSSTNYADYTTRNFKGRSLAQAFTRTEKLRTFDPKYVTVRESRDSVAHPESNAIIVALDVTGSLGHMAKTIAEKGLGTLIEGILDTQPVKDPQVCIMAVGDVDWDSAPLQVTQFESGIEIVQQLKEIYLEGGGGGNDSESYTLPWYFASEKTSIDCFEKRGKKGYLFTIGDEKVPHTLTKTQIGSVLNSSGQTDFTSAELYELVSKKYEVFHLIIEEGNYCRRNKEGVVKSWRDLIGHRAIFVSNHEYVADVILATIRVSEGEDPNDVIESYQNPIREVVRHALLD